MLSVAEEQRENTEVRGRYGVQKLIKPPVVAERLDIPVSTVYELVRQKRIGGAVKMGRQVRFDPDKLEQWIESGGQALPGGWRQRPQ